VCQTSIRSLEATIAQFAGGLTDRGIAFGKDDVKPPR